VLTEDIDSEQGSSPASRSIGQTSRTGGSLIDKLGLRNSAQAEEERLMQLFQNRAGLKKAYADLQDEFHLLRDRLKQQEGATIRVQEQLDALGDQLGDPAAGFSALVFFQLRALWKLCHQQLANFATDLTRQQEARESARHEADSHARREALLADVGRRLEEASALADEERIRLASLQQHLDSLKAFWHYFTRRKLQREIDEQRQKMATADAAVGDLHAERSAAENEPLPEFLGISLEARRTINLAIIGYAEVLCERLHAIGLATRAKEVIARRVQEMNFGARAQCDALMAEIQKGFAIARSERDVAVHVKGKIERYRVQCSYRNESDTVPTSDSLAEQSLEDVLKKTAKPAGGMSWNVLAEDYWDLYTLMLR
jgi:hypothetical protein